MYFNRYDICEAWYLYLTQYYYGQGDPLYSRLCKLRSYFTPSDSLRDVSDLSDNGKEIFLQLALNNSPVGASK